MNYDALAVAALDRLTQFGSARVTHVDDHHEAIRRAIRAEARRRRQRISTGAFWSRSEGYNYVDVNTDEEHLSIEARAYEAATNRWTDDGQKILTAGLEAWNTILGTGPPPTVDRTVRFVDAREYAG